MSENKKIEIIPAILPVSFKDLESHVTLLGGAAPRVQVDIVDGHYARGKTWPFRDRKSFDKIVEREHGLPAWDSIDYQFDLMVEQPELDLMKYVTAGATQVVIHARSPGAQAALQALVDRRDEMGTFSVGAGIAIGATSPPDDLEPFESQFDFVQVMGIDHEGRQGEAFDKKALYLVERIHSRYPNLPIQVDGGITKENALQLVEAGANRLVAGSAIFGAEDPRAAYKELYNLVNAH